MKAIYIGIVILAIWLAGGAVPAAAADPALKLLLKKGIITQEEYDQALRETGQAVDTPIAAPEAAVPSAKAAPVKQAASPVPANEPDGDTTVDLGKGIKFGYDRGLYTQFKDKFLLKIRIRIQTRFTDSHFNGPYNTIGDLKNYPLVSVAGAITPLRHTESLDEFGVHRTRLVFEGFAFSPDINYFVQFRSDTNDATTQQGGSRSMVQLYDSYLTFKQLSWANLRIGQYRTLFGRQEYVSSALLQFVDRGFVAEAFVPSTIDRRDQGVTLFSDPEKHRFNYAFGVFNGVGINLTRISLNTPSNANELMYVGRLTADILGKPGYPEGDLAYSAVPQLAVGASYGYNGGLQTNTVGPGSNNQVSTAMTSLGNGRLLNQGVVNLGTAGVDMVFKYMGFSLQAEGFVRNVEHRDQNAPAAVQQTYVGNATGFYVQGGYFVLPKTLEIVGRYSYMDPDTRMAHDIITSEVGGLNWYINGHEHKVQADYGLITTRLSALDAGGATTLIENRFRLQYTIVF